MHVRMCVYVYAYMRTRIYNTKNIYNKRNVKLKVRSIQKINN